MRYYDLNKNWKRVRWHIGRPDVQKVLVTDFNKYTYGRWRQKFEPGMKPAQFESCDWQHDHQGKKPAYWDYTKHAACHWLVNFELCLAQRVVPRLPWRIITSQKHSTVWDGGLLLFDFNFQAMGISPDECFGFAHETELKPGEMIKVYLAQHYKRNQDGDAE